MVQRCFMRTRVREFEMQHSSTMNVPPLLVIGGNEARPQYLQ